MKHKSTDMKEILTTGEDRVAKANQVKKDFEQHKAVVTLRITRRKLAGGEKFYFHVDAVGGEYIETQRFSWKQGVRGLALPIIQAHFPDVSITSGGGTSVTFSEY